MTIEALLLAQSKQNFESAATLPYPPELTISGWWKRMQEINREKILGFKECSEAIRHAQIGVHSGFDHRETVQQQARQTVTFKLHELQRLFPDLLEKNLPCESEHSISESLIEVGAHRFSSIFLTHLYFYLRTESLLGDRIKTRVLEIGSGYGGLARIYRTMQQGPYVLVDLPESLFYAQVFLGLNFPNAKTLYVDRGTFTNFDDYDFVFVPAQLAHTLQGLEFDLVVNTGSLQEMTTSAVFYWMEFIQHTIRARLFYSWNYFLNDKSKFGEARQNRNPICPVLDAFWRVRYFRINDPVLTIDANQRNWLEVGVERMPTEEQSTLDKVKYLNELITNANSFPIATNNWFQNIWMAIWINQAPFLLKAMLDGIALFAKGRAPGIVNHLSTTKFDEVQFYKNLDKKERKRKWIF